MKLTVLKLDNTSSTIDVEINNEEVNVGYDVAVINRVKNQGLKQGSKKVKTRAEVRGGKAKPYKQKGTGRARQGSIVGPHQTGGGVAHGPRQDTTKLKLNKKYKITAKSRLVSELIRNNKLSLLDMQGDKKALRNFFGNYAKSLLVYNDKANEDLRAMSNLSHVDTVHIDEMGLFNLIGYQNIFIDMNSKEKLLSILN